MESNSEKSPSKVRPEKSRVFLFELYSRKRYFFKNQSSNRAAPSRTTRYLETICKKEVFKKGDRIYTQKIPTETSNPVLTGYGFMLIPKKEAGEFIRLSATIFHRLFPLNETKVTWKRKTCKQRF